MQPFHRPVVSCLFLIVAAAGDDDDDDDVVDVCWSKMPCPYSARFTAVARGQCS